MRKRKIDRETGKKNQPERKKERERDNQTENGRGRKRGGENRRDSWAVPGMFT